MAAGAQFRSVAAGALLISVVTIAARLLGFGRWAVFSATVGSTATGSAYTAANALPNVLFEVAAGGALAAVVVPVLVLPLAKQLHGQVNQIVSGLLTWSLVVLVPLAVGLGLAAEPLARLLIRQQLEAANPGMVALTATFIRIFVLQVPLYGMGLIAAGCLQASKRFFWPALAPVLSSLTVIGVYAWFGHLVGGDQGQPVRLDSTSVYLLGWGTTAGVAMLTLPLLVPLWRSGLRFYPTLRFPAGLGRQVARLAGAGITALMAQQTCTLVVVWLAGNYGAPGTLPTFHYAQALYLLPYAVLVVPLATAFFPYSAGEAAAGQTAAFRSGAAVAIRAVIVVAALGACALVAASPGLTSAFSVIDAGAVPGLQSALVWMAPGLVGFGVMAVGQRLLFASHRGRLAAVTSSAGWLGAAVLAVVLVVLPNRATGAQAAATTLRGVAIGLTAGMTLAGALMLIGVGLALGKEVLSGTGRSTLVAAFGAVIGGLVGRVAGGAVGGTTLAGALIAALVGGLVAVLLAGGVVLIGDRGLVRTWRG